MMDEMQGVDLRERFDLVESMLREGRETTQAWGWMFVLWGVAYLIAIGGSYVGGATGQYAWPVVMVATFLLGSLISSAKKKGHPQSIKSRAIGAIWSAMAAALFLFAFSVAFSTHNEVHILLTGILVLIGVPHFASSLVLKWRLQMGVALVWWVAAAACSYVGTELLMPILVVANLIGNLGFGGYLMVAEAQERKKRLVHARVP